MVPKTRVTLIGLGTMGTGMAGRLIAAGFPLTVFNRNASKAEALVKAGATLAASPRDAAAGADVVLSMLSDDDAARQVWLGEHGVISGAKRGAILIECSTVSPGWIRELAAAAATAGCELLDAPVTGSKPQAAAGQLVFLAGGSAAALDTARPVLAAMSKDIIHLGPTGSGAMMKLINNFVCGVQVTALAEAIAFIERTDLDPAKAVAVLTEGAPGSPMVKTLSGRMTARDYTPNFMLKLLTKDVTYAIAEARKLAIPLATAEATVGVLKTAIDAGHGEQDMASVIEPLRRG
jgi:3-hydroxyisobutyrate dehydrogenase